MNRIFIMDNVPCQNSKIAKAAIKGIGTALLKILPRSPDLNPIENIFQCQENTARRSTKRENYL